MDLLCKHCGEPFDPFEFHDARSGTYQQWCEQFKKKGCTVVDALFDEGIISAAKRAKKCSNTPCVDQEVLDKVDALQDMLGDDIDGLQAMTDDVINGFM